MEDLIKALQIFLKYGNPRKPSQCEHDEFHIDIDPKLVSEEDIQELERLSFWRTIHGRFVSYRFGEL